MGNIETFIHSASPPGVLYWYATPRELMNMLDKQALLAPDIRYLNDNIELTYLIEIVMMEIERIMAAEDSSATVQNQPHASTPLDQRENLFREIINRLTTSPQYQLFTCYLYQEGDLFSCWRNGGPNGKRYSLGFDTKQMLRLTEPLQFKLVKCVFDERQQKQAIRNLLGESVRRISSLPAEAPDLMLQVNNIADNFLVYCIQFSALFKHPASFQGILWCLLSMPTTITPADPLLQFREINGLIAPCMELKLIGNQSDHFPLTRLIIGPTPHRELAADSVELLLAARGIRNCRMEISRIPHGKGVV